ncbi:hypothetical protein QBC34DRAFT_430533 [Podospora aff. communis PSN243]|uniref:Uncharacterized protein n=1 Tax=Podospora aff. communis PSN243 TaxID=3040156 RepID=A0AAV9G6G9_9PEZI|nr:hypothetical protein QBC34DRAFT_430533 [Podospora aff. communis PSN243]
MAREERKKFPFSTQQKWMASVIFLLVAVILLLWIAIAIGSVVEMPGLMDVYLLEMNFPACSRTLRIGYYGMCGFHDGQFACHPTGPGSKPAELHDSLYSKIVHSEAHCPTLEAISAGLKLQYEVIYCVQMGALAIFLVGIGVSVVWAFAAKAAWYKTDLLREEEDEPLSRWESRVKHCIRLHRLSYRLQPLAWGFVVLSAVVCFASTLSVSQAAGALTYASEAFPMPMEIRVGRKVLILQGVELGLLVLLLVVFLVYVHRTKTAVWRLISIHPGDPKAAPDRMDHHLTLQLQGDSMMSPCGMVSAPHQYWVKVLQRPPVPASTTTVRSRHTIVHQRQVHAELIGD